jgi:GNAT superfamily N-acetyltransferase
MALVMQIELAADPDEALRRAVMMPLLAFNTVQAGPSGHQTLALAVRDERGVVLGGLWGATAYGWLYTQMLSVPEAARGQGLGRQMMQAAEAEARLRGCRHAWVDSQFGARGFYEKLGYRVFGELPDYPPGFSRSFLTKALD